MAGEVKRGESPEELALIASVAAGDAKALATLYDRYGSLLMGLAMKILDDKAEVEDLLHDVFVEVWQKAGTYDPARGSVRSWLCLRMRSRALDRSRLSRRTRSKPLAEPNSAEGSGVELVADIPSQKVMQRGRLLVALESLADPLRTVISMAYFRGLSCSEIAQNLGIPIGTVKSRLAGARKGLERALSDGGASS